MSAKVPETNLRDRSYDEKKSSLQEALSLIKTGNHIFIGSACGEPQHLVNGLVELGSHLADNEILHVHTLGVAPYANPRYSGRFRLNAFFVGVRPGVKEKKGPAVDQVVLETFDEGLSAQVMHIGPYSEEGPTVKMLHDFIHGNGYKMRGRHHEIYLGDPRRTDPAKLKTIIRQPVEKA